MTLRMIDTFSGIGGFSLAARWLGGFGTVQFVEREPFCQRILRKHWPDVPIHDDICTFNPAPGSADVVVGGFPCQDISQAGKGAGLAGERSGLFYELLRVVRMVGPRYVVLENVAAIIGRGLDDVLGTLAEAGYDAEWACIPASSLGACHQRYRWWCVAYAQGGRWGARPGQGEGQTGHEGPRTGDGAEGFVADATNMLGNGGTGQQPGNLEGDRFPNLETVMGQLLTPTAADWKGRTNWQAAGRNGPQRLPDLIPTGVGMYLNPSFVEEMMGFPVGWTA